MKLTVLSPIILLLLITLLSSCASPRPWTAGEKALLATSFVATGANIYAASEAFDRDCEELNPALRWNPLLAMVFNQTLAVILVHFVPELRKPLLGAKTVINTGLAVHDHRAGRDK